MTIPEIRIDELSRKITTTSGEPVLVIINGKKASAEELLTLATNRVSKIEFQNNIGAKYSEDSYGAILNIYVTPEESGISGGVNLIDAITTLAGENYGFVRYNHKNNEFGLTLQNSYSYVKKRSMSQYDKYQLAPNKEVAVDREGMYTPLYYMNNEATLHYNYTKPQKRIFNTSLSASWYTSPERSTIQNVTEMGLPTYTARYAPTEDYISTALDLFYLTTVSHGGTLSLNTHGTYISTKYGYSFSEKHPTGGERTYSYSTNGKKHSLITELRYDQPIGDVQLGVGSRYLLGYTQNTYINNQPQQTSLINHDLYLYSQLEGKIKTLNYNVGVGATLIANNQGKESIASWLMRPRIMLALPFKGWNFQFYFAMDSNAPTLAMLSDISQRSNNWEITTGNPKLKPYSRYRTSLTIRHAFNQQLFFSLRGGYILSVNPIIQTISKIKQNDEILFNHSFANNGKEQRPWASLAFQWNAIPDMLQISSSLNYDYYNTSSHEYHHKLNNLSLNLSAQFFKGNWNLGANFYTRNKSLEGEIITIQNPNLNFRIGYHLGNWTLGLITNNLFQPNGPMVQEKLLNSLHNYTQIIRIPSMENLVLLSVAYNFTKGRQYEAPESTIVNSDDDRGILQVQK